jgi:hypothetical protein
MGNERAGVQVFRDYTSYQVWRARLIYREEQYAIDIVTNLGYAQSDGGGLTFCIAGIDDGLEGVSAAYVGCDVSGVWA